MTSILLDRSMYMAQVITNREYYGQFISVYPEINDFALSVADEQELKTAFEANEHFNSIPLSKWDAEARYLFKMVPGLEKSLRECGDYPTLAGAVCLLKEAALRLIEGNN